MKVKELIKKLKALDQNAIVVVTTDNFEMGNNNIPARGVYEFAGKIVKEGFRDAFDGGSYSADVVRHDEKGKTKFVQIT
jgi:arylsulfatase A-like enzyme